MNKSYKVVFSKARGALMVVNELTSSVQAKGTKTVVAAAVAGLMAAGAAVAAEAVDPNKVDGVTYESGVTTLTGAQIDSIDDANKIWKEKADVLVVKGEKGAASVVGGDNGYDKWQHGNFKEDVWRANPNVAAEGSFTVGEGATLELTKNGLVTANGGDFTLEKDAKLVVKEDTKNGVAAVRVTNGGKLLLNAGSELAVKANGKAQIGAPEVVVTDALLSVAGDLLIAGNVVEANQPSAKEGEAEAPKQVLDSNFDGVVIGYAGQNDDDAKPVTVTLQKTKQQDKDLGLIAQDKNITVTEGSVVNVLDGAILKAATTPGQGTGDITIDGQVNVGGELFGTTYDLDKKPGEGKQYQDWRKASMVYAEGSGGITVDGELNLDRNGLAVAQKVTVNGDVNFKKGPALLWGYNESGSLTVAEDGVVTVERGADAVVAGQQIAIQGEVIAEGNLTFAGAYVETETSDTVKTSTLTTLGDGIVIGQGGSNGDKGTVVTVGNNGYIAGKSLKVLKGGKLTGSGEVEVDTLTVDHGGEVELTDDGYIVINGKSGALKVAKAVEADTENKVEAKEAGTFKISGGTLQTGSANLFTLSQKEDKFDVKLVDGLSSENFAGGEVALTDRTTFTKAQYDAVRTGLGVGEDGNLVYLNGVFQPEDGKDVTFDDVAGIGGVAVNNAVTVKSDEKDPTKATQNLTKEVAVGAVKVDDKVKTLTFTGDQHLTIDGLNGKTFQGAALENFEAEKVLLGFDEDAKATVNVKNFKATKWLGVEGEFDAQNVEVGEADIEGQLSLESLKVNGQGGARVSGALVLKGAKDEDGKAATELTGTVNVVEDGVLTTNVAGAKAALDMFASWDEEPGALVYVDRTLKLAKGAKLTIGDAPSSAADAQPSDKTSVDINDTAVVNAAGFITQPVVEPLADDAEEPSIPAVFEGADVTVNGELLLTNVNKLGLVKIGDTLAGEANEDVNVESLFVVVDSIDRNGTVKLGYNEGAAGKFDDALESKFRAGLSGKELSILSAIESKEAFVAETDDDLGKLSAAGIQALEQATGGNATAGVLNVAYDANEEVTNAIVRHQLAAHQGYGAWADVFMTKNEAKKLYGDTGYEADIYGGIFGFDATFSCGATAGIALTIGQADADSVGGVLSNSVESDFFGASVYAAKEMAGLHVKADLGYLDFSNDFSGIGDASDASSVTFGVRGDFTALEAAGIAVKPHFGLRYTYIDSDAVAFNDAQSLNVFEMPVGVAFEGAFEVEGWKFVPSADVTVVPQLGDKEVDVFADEVTILHSGLVNTKFGLEASQGNLSFGLNAGFGFGTDDRANTSVNANVRYAF